MTPLKNPHISLHEEEDKDFEFEEPMREIHTELKILNDEVVVLAGKIQKSFEKLGYKPQRAQSYAERNKHGANYNH